MHYIENVQAYEFVIASNSVFLLLFIQKYSILLIVNKKRRRLNGANRLPLMLIVLAMFYRIKAKLRASFYESYVILTF